MEYVIRFAISLFDLAVFMYYFHSNKKMKPVSKVWIWAGFTIAAVIWTFVSSIKNPYLNLATLLIVLILLSFYYISGMWTRIINIVTFMGIGMLFEPVALLLLHAMNFHMGESYKYYFVMVVTSKTSITYCVYPVRNTNNALASIFRISFASCKPFISGISMSNIYR